MGYAGYGSYFLSPMTGMGSYYPISGFGALDGVFVDAANSAKWLVGKGDYGLSAIAQQVYGSSTPWRAIYDANKSIIGSNPDLIQPGMILTLPTVPGFPPPQGALSQTKNVAGSTSAVVANQTIVGNDGKDIVIGSDGKGATVVTATGAKTASMSTGAMVGIGAIAVVAIGGLALAAKKKKPAYSANRRRRHHRRH